MPMQFRQHSIGLRVEIDFFPTKYGGEAQAGKNVSLRKIFRKRTLDELLIFLRPLECFCEWIFCRRAFFLASPPTLSGGRREGRGWGGKATPTVGQSTVASRCVWTLFAMDFLFLLLFFVLCSLAVIALLLGARDKGAEAPGPRPWPLIGCLPLLAGHDTPFEAFSALARRYGAVYALRLGAVSCLVVSGPQLIRQVLLSNAFGGRPDFLRFHALFGGDRDNSLALCDWSDLQRTRRRIARLHCSPRFASAHHDRLDEACASEAEALLSQLLPPPGAARDVRLTKPLLLAACANVFTRYMCTRRFDYEDAEFRDIVRRFDLIFWDINQGYAVDFLPWLAPLYQSHLRRLSGHASHIRQFILKHIVEPRRGDKQPPPPSYDFTEALLSHLEQSPDESHLSWEHVLFELEDFLGGHSAIGNLLMLALASAAQHPQVAVRIRAEADEATGGGKRALRLSDRMPFVEATVLETLRTASSPIVPHVATEDTTVSGYTVSKGTVVFLNNYELNRSEELWQAPMDFRPERFLSADGTGLTKPNHFLPFGTGRRTCIGQRLVHSCSFVLLATLLQHFDVSADEAICRVPACVALPPDTFTLRLTPRSHNPIYCQ
ncbi:cytochrome P450 307a1-like [Ischnura elegans]|uniref:cytochrome P450 307a1-like n=1 Tax=Ischnura elegans TaxID=197161 RepID=UPI001ED86E82|nr:cytochrome P450 307a1-like [Ischnura elegans]